MWPTGVEPTVQTHRAHCLGKVWKGGFGAIVATLSAMAGAFLAGCGAGAAVGSLQMRSLGQDPVVLTGSYVTAFYSDRGPAQISFLLADVGLQELLSDGGGRALWFRAIGSTLVGEFVDTVIFVSIAFYATFSAAGLIKAIFALYIWKVAVEVLFLPATYVICRRLKRAEGIDVYDYGVKYNPLRWRE